MSPIDETGLQPPYPLHSSIKDKLDPAYVSFYNAHIFDKQQVHLQPVSASRTSGILIPGGGPKLPVGKTEDIQIQRKQTEGPDVPIRVFTPEEERPVDGWPVMVYYHGGGWVLGNIETENTVCTNLCKRARCVVISMDYRYFPPLNPESKISDLVLEVGSRRPISSSCPRLLGSPPLAPKYRILPPQPQPLESRHRWFLRRG